MVQQVITFHPDGSMSGLQTKPGQGINLQSFGKAKTRRASEIEWCDEQQHWYVKVLVGVYAGRKLTASLWDKVYGAEYLEGVRISLPEVSLYTHDDCMYFADYAEAVEVEIAFLNNVRLSEGAKALQ